MSAYAPGELLSDLIVLLIIIGTGLIGLFILAEIKCQGKVKTNTNFHPQAGWSGDRVVTLQTALNNANECVSIWSNRARQAEKTGIELLVALQNLVLDAGQNSDPNTHLEEAREVIRKANKELL